MMFSLVPRRRLGAPSRFVGGAWMRPHVSKVRVRCFLIFLRREKRNTLRMRKLYQALPALWEGPGYEARE